ncbi:MAG: hypothetical protein ACI85N_000055 [Gammaproteobacteria bacterium]|jgi:hypothetical protein
MLTFEDCLALCDLSVDEIAAIAEHEHLPEMAALGYGDYLIHGPDGEQHIKRMIVEDIENAKASGNLKHVEELEAILKTFIVNHPKLLVLLEARTQ